MNHLPWNHIVSKYARHAAFVLSMTNGKWKAYACCEYNLLIKDSHPQKHGVGFLEALARYEERLGTSFKFMKQRFLVVNVQCCWF